MRLILTVTLLGCVISSGACKTKEEVLAEQEEKGKFETEKKAQLVKGIGEGLKGKGKEGMQALSEGVGEVFKGAAKGIDASLTAVKSETGDGVADKGITFSRASRYTDDPAKGKIIAAYLMFEKDFVGMLQLRAMSDDGSEVGRAVLEVKGTAGDARYVDFGFDDRTPLASVDHFTLVAP